MFNLSRITTIAAAEEAGTMAINLQAELVHRVGILERLLNSSQSTSQELTNALNGKDYALEAFQLAGAAALVPATSVTSQSTTIQAAKDQLEERGSNISEDGILVRSEKIEMLNNHIAIIETYLTELSVKKATLTA